MKKLIQLPGYFLAISLILMCLSIILWKTNNKVLSIFLLFANQTWSIYLMYRSQQVEILVEESDWKGCFDKEKEHNYSILIPQKDHKKSNIPHVNMEIYEGDEELNFYKRVIPNEIKVSKNGDVIVEIIATSPPKSRIVIT